MKKNAKDPFLRGLLVGWHGGGYRKWSIDQGSNQSWKRLIEEAVDPGSGWSRKQSIKKAVDCSKEAVDQSRKQPRAQLKSYKQLEWLLTMIFGVERPVNTVGRRSVRLTPGATTK